MAPTMIQFPSALQMLVNAHQALTLTAAGYQDGVLFGTVLLLYLEEGDIWALRDFDTFTLGTREGRQEFLDRIVPQVERDEAGVTEVLLALSNAAMSLLQEGQSEARAQHTTSQSSHKARTKLANGKNDEPLIKQRLSEQISHLEWPVMPEKAYHGIAGKIVETLAPHSESDPVALLLQLLVYWGTVLGRDAYYPIEATRHYPNMFLGLVGPTGKGRKGTAYDHIEYYMKAIDTSWTTNNKGGGCGSGEGLIYAVRDAVKQRVPKRDKNRTIVDYEEVISDHGVIDKRYLLYESELTGVLKVCQRDGNILSETMRQAWDHGNLHNTVKSNPYHATNAHISVIGHLTIDGLQRYLTSAEMANGFGNRFLWPLVRRSKPLPDGGKLRKVNAQPLIKRLREVFKQAKTVKKMRRDIEAKAIWHTVYEPLSNGKPGLVGALLGRGEAQVLRLSMLYALLDGTGTIGKDHLNAALAVWQYCETNALYIFGTFSGDEDADTLLGALQAVYPQGLARKFVLEETFQRHLRADELDRIIALLVTQRRITDTEVAREKGTKAGRKKHVLTYRPCELSELSETTYLSLSNDAVKFMSQSSHPLRALCELWEIEAIETEEDGSEEDGSEDTDSLVPETSPDATVDPVDPVDAGVPTYEPGPCVNCQGTERWDDEGIARCVVCWPPPAPQPDPEPAQPQDACLNCRNPLEGPRSGARQCAFCATVDTRV